MTSISLGKCAAALVVSSLLVACGPPDEASRVQAGPIVGPFVVSNFFTPSGFMGDGAIPGRLTVGINENCKMPRPAGAQGDCYHFLYKVGDVKWAGAYWVYPSNSWGSVPGRNVVGPNNLGPKPDGSGDMLGYHQVRFWAAMDPLPKPTFFQFYAGGIDGRKATPPQKYYDHGCQIFAGMPPFCDDGNGGFNPFAPTGGDYLAAEPAAGAAGSRADWKQFTLTQLSQWSIDSLIGAFGWSTNDSDNPGQTQSIYLDDIVWE